MGQRIEWQPVRPAGHDIGDAAFEDGPTEEIELSEDDWEEITEPDLPRPPPLQPFLVDREDDEEGEA